MSYSSYRRFEAYLAGTLSAEEKFAFAESLDRDDQLAKEFVEYMRLAALTAETVNRRGTSGSAEAETFVEDLSSSIDSASPESESKKASLFFPGGGALFEWPQWASMVVLVVASGLLVAVTLWSVLSSDRPSSDLALRASSPAGDAKVVRPSSVGAISQQWKVAWTNPDTAVGNWTPLMVGDQFSFDSGEIEFNFHVGASLIARGPARFEILAADSIHVEYGTVSARVSEGGRGFSIVTALGRVIDIGTEFGLQVDRDGGIDVVVFEGRVDLEAGGQVRRIDSGRAVRLNSNGGASRIDQVAYDRFPRTSMFFQERGSGEPVIRGIKDNLREDGVGPYYQICHGGLREDCQAYVDRGYEWNGLDETGLPDYLVGADYVLMFNDDKTQNDFEVYLELWRPADVYVFWDERVPPPAWLQERFTSTGDLIGMDEGQSSLQGVQSVLSVGPGRSVDYPFSVWRARVDDIRQPVKLGSLDLDDPRHPYAVPSSMYGVAAVGRPAVSPPREVED